MLAVLGLQPSAADAQFRYPPIYPIYPAYRYAVPDASVRVQVRPSDASVYVDGFFAGKVDEFDGAFQRLHVQPGQHEIVVYLEGYRSLRERLYLSPNSTRRVEGRLEKLAPGESLEPVPTPPPDIERRDEPAPRPPARGAGLGPRRGQPIPPQPPDRRPPPPDAGERRGPATDSTSGVLEIRVQPGGATVLIDGERWTGPGDSERLIVQVAEGRHHIEADRNGYDKFEIDVDVRRGETAPVNISLSRNR